MFREFNVKFEDVEMIGGADNLLEGTEITKVIVRGDNNKMSSLDSMLKNCSELDTIDGELDLNGVSDIDNLLEGTELVKNINLKNINNENISANNSFPHVDRINIGGELYNKKAMQNVIASKDWTFDNINYSGTVGDNIVTKEVNIVDDNKTTIQDTLEQKARGFEIIGQTYENLVVGSGEATLLDELTLESVDGNSKEFNPHLEQPVCVESIEGETYQNLIEGKGEYKLTDAIDERIVSESEIANGIENLPSVIEITSLWGNTYQNPNNLNEIVSLGDLYVDESGEPILDEEGNEQYKLELISNDGNSNLNKTTILMPCQLSRIKGSSTYDITDKLLFNKDKGTYIIEKNINTYTTPTINYTGTLDIYLNLPRDMVSSDNNINNYPFIIEGAKVQGWLMGNLTEFAIKRYDNDTMVRLATSSSFTNEEISTFLSNKKVYYVTNSPQTIETKILEKPSLETYSPKTYISTNTEIQPSQMTVTNKKVDFIPLGLQANKDYTLQLDVLGYKLPLIYKHYDFKTSLIDELDIVYNSGSLRDYKISNGKLIVNEVGSSSSYSSISFKNILPNIYNEDFYFTTNLKITSTDSSNSNEIRIQNDNGSTGSFTRFNPNGEVSFDTYDNTVISNGVLPNKDYKIQIHFKKSSNSYDVYLNDNLFTSNKPYKSQDYPFGGLRMMIRNCSVEISDIIVHKDKNIDSAQGKLNINLGGMEKELQIEELKRYKIQLSTPSTLTTDKLELSGEGTVVSNVMLFEGGSNEIKQEVEYVEGIQSIGELQEDGTYKIDILTESSTLKGLTKGIGTQVTPKRFMIESKNGSWSSAGIVASSTYKKLNTPYTVCIKVISKNLLDSNYKDYGFAGSWRGSSNAILSFRPDLEVGVVYKKSITPQEDVKEGDTICAFQFTNNAVNGQHMEIEIWLEEDVIKSETQLLIPQPLNKIGDIKDKFYWDDNKGHYCIEQHFTRTVFDGSDDEDWREKYLSGNEDKSRHCYCPLNVSVYPKFATTDNVVLCDKLTWRHAHNWGTKGVPIEDEFLINTNEFCVFKSSISTVSEFKEWISQNPITLIHPLETPKIIDLPHLNKKYSLDTYMPTTYLECTNNPMQPSRLLLESDTVRYKPSALETDTDYTVQFECKEKSDKKVKLNLGGTEKEVDAEVGLNHVSITTPSELSQDRLFLSGAGNKVADIIVNKGEMNQYPEYFNGVQNTGELQDDGTYRIGIKTNEGFNISIQTNNPLAKGDRLYWNKSNKRYEIDRNGDIEVPTVSGDIIDLPRLYQREDTRFSTSTGNIKPSKIKLDYNDLD